MWTRRRLITSALAAAGAALWPHGGAQANKPRKSLPGSVETPDVSKAPWTPQEDAALREAQGKLGNKWRRIAELIPGRAENDIKNRFNALERCRRSGRARPGRRRGRPRADPVFPYGTIVSRLLELS